MQVPLRQSSSYVKGPSVVATFDFERERERIRVRNEGKQAKHSLQKVSGCFSHGGFLLIMKSVR
jgi:hypothetical protein